MDLTSLSEDDSAYRWRKPKERYLDELLWPGTDIDDQNNYTRPVQAALIETEEGILKGREEDRRKISMAAIPLKPGEQEAFNEGNV